MTVELSAGEKVQVSANGTNWFDATVAGTQWLGQVALSSGSGTLSVRTIDAAGNTTAGAATQSYTLDTTKPTAAATFSTTVIDADENGTLDEGETVTITFAEAIDIDTLVQGDVFATGALTSAAEAKLGTGYSVAAVSPSNGLATAFTITLGQNPTLGTNDPSLAFSKSKISDVAGNLSASNITFTTPPDVTAPSINYTTVLSYDPLLTMGETVAVGTEITIRFNEPIDTTKLTLNDISVDNGHTFGGNSTLAPISPSDGYAQEFKITLGSESDIQLGDNLTILSTAISDAAGNVAPSDRTEAVATTATLKLTASTDVRGTAFDKTVIRQALLNGKTLTITADQADNLYIEQGGPANSNIIVYGLEDFATARFASFYNNGSKTIYADDDLTFTGTLPLTSFNGAGQIVIAAGKTITINAGKFTANNNKISGDGTVYVTGGEGGVTDITILRLQNVTANIDTTSVNDGEPITTMTLPTSITTGKTLTTTLAQLTAVTSKPTISGSVVLVGELADFYDTGTQALTTGFAAIKNLTGYSGVKTTLTDTTIDAAHLNGLDGLLSGPVDATSVNTLTGALAQVASALGASGITGLIDPDVTLSAASVVANDIINLRSLTNGTIDGSALTAIDGTIAEINAALTALDTDPTNFNSTLSAGAEVATDIT
ncbi:MAG: hypothetical protein ACKO0Z_06605, partial [Betaproteobacteria bacterium]